MSVGNAMDRRRRDVAVSLRSTAHAVVAGAGGRFNGRGGQASRVERSDIALAFHQATTTRVPASPSCPSSSARLPRRSRPFCCRRRARIQQDHLPGADERHAASPGDQSRACGFGGFSRASKACALCDRIRTASVQGQGGWCGDAVPGHCRAVARDSGTGEAWAGYPTVQGSR